MARLSQLTGRQRRESLASHPLLPQFILFLLLILLMYYLLYKQKQRFSEVRLPSGLLPT
jgi:hypothetical protein